MAISQESHFPTRCAYRSEEKRLSAPSLDSIRPIPQNKQHTLRSEMRRLLPKWIYDQVSLWQTTNDRLGAEKWVTETSNRSTGVPADSACEETFGKPLDEEGVGLGYIRRYRRN